MCYNVSTSPMHNGLGGSGGAQRSTSPPRRESVGVSTSRLFSFSDFGDYDLHSAGLPLYRAQGGSGDAVANGSLLAGLDLSAEQSSRQTAGDASGVDGADLHGLGLLLPAADFDLLHTGSGVAHTRGPRRRCVGLGRGMGGVCVFVCVRAWVGG